MVRLFCMSPKTVGVPPTPCVSAELGVARRGRDHRPPPYHHAQGPDIPPPQTNSHSGGSVRDCFWLVMAAFPTEDAPGNLWGTMTVMSEVATGLRVISLRRHRSYGFKSSKTRALAAIVDCSHFIFSLSMLNTQQKANQS